VKKNLRSALDEKPIFRVVADTVREMGVDG
jgi:hypothetical protein